MKPFLFFFEFIGEKTFSFYSAIYEAIYFSSLCIIHLFSPSSYNPAMRSVLLKQIYFTVVQILPSFILIGFIFGSLTVGYVITLAMQFGLKAQIGPMLIGFVFNEFAPLFTAILIALRSGAAVNAEIAVMQVSGELNTLNQYDVSLIDYLFLPRIISGMISSVALAFLFAIIMLAGGYIFAFFYIGMDFYAYTNTLLTSVQISNLANLIIKSMAFGFVIMLIPIYSGLTTIKAFNAIPISVLTGMVRLFIAIFTIEVFSFLFRLI